ncbi:MAG: hypothetical protein RAK22_02645, partial [Nanoarchaeota archaeon]|nr:hypothetical protein [Nanoarchaeota archaeon]
SRRISFLMDIDAKVEKGSIAIIGNANIPTHIKLENLSILVYHHPNLISRAFRLGFEIALENNVDKIITFEDYSSDNSTWFAPYLLFENLVESGKRDLFETVLTEITNLISLKSVYSAFSMNRILNREAMKVVVEKVRNDRNFALRLTNVLSENGVKVTEIIRNDKRHSRKNINMRQAIASVVDSVNTSTILYSISSAATYLLNIFIVYFSISLGLLYPFSLLIGQEISLISNFAVTRHISLRKRNLSFSSLGKYNGIILSFVALDVLIIALIEHYMSWLDLPTSILAVAITVIVSVVSMITINKFVWGSGNPKIKYS